MNETPNDIPDHPGNEVCQYTDGLWPDEGQAKAELDGRLARCGLFAVYAEVSGEYVQPRYMTPQQRPRIDRLLIPKPKLLEAGWNHGAIGVECKCSGYKLGAAVLQCQDYGRAVFRTPTNFAVMCEWVFIWPLSKYLGDIASVMTQNRIGGVTGSNYDLLRFKCANRSLMTIGWDGSIDVRPCTTGRKVGSR